jgi:hypothetical protein
MGRGRAKAKQTKVARELKYHVPSTDFSALQAELSTGGGSSYAVDQLEHDTSDELDDADADPYAAEDDEQDGPVHAAR